MELLLILIVLTYVSYKYIFYKIKERKNKLYIEEITSFYEHIQQCIPEKYRYHHTGEEIFKKYIKKFVDRKDIKAVVSTFDKEYMDSLNKYVYSQKAKNIYNNLNELYVNSYPDYNDKIKKALKIRHRKYGNYYYRIFNRYKNYNNNLSINENVERLTTFEKEYRASLERLIYNLVKEEKERTEKEKQKEIISRQEKQCIEKYGKELSEYINPKKKLSSEELGLRFERYIGYIYEQNGYNNVNYNGATKKRADGGIDLIIKTKDTHIIIQCKYYGKNNLIHENSINQFYSAFLKYKKKNPNLKINAIFATAHDNLDDEARESLKIFEEITHKVFKMEYPIEYPTIKCNINKNDKRKIYHLPTDPNYDRIKINIHRGNFYCFTPNEAEQQGFIRSRSNNRR